MRVQGAQAEQKKGEKVEVLSTGAIPEVNLSPPTVVGATPGAEDSAGSFDNAVARETVNLTEVSPVVGDATTKGRKELPANAEVKPVRTFRVMNAGGKFVQDSSGSGRVHLHEGKEIANAHYDIRKLQQQGLRLQEITHLKSDEPVEFIDD